jgi:hypothetical protein
MLKKLCFEQKKDFTEAMQFIAESWKALSQADKNKY